MGLETFSTQIIGGGDPTGEWIVRVSFKQTKVDAKPGAKRSHMRYLDKIDAYERSKKQLLHPT